MSIKNGSYYNELIITVHMRKLQFDITILQYVNFKLLKSQLLKKKDLIYERALGGFS